MAAPKKQLKKSGFWIARFMDCIAEIYALFDRRVKPGVTEQDQAKKRPAIKAVVVAETIGITIFIIGSDSIFCPGKRQTFRQLFQPGFGFSLMDAQRNLILHKPLLFSPIVSRDRLLARCAG